MKKLMLSALLVLGFAVSLVPLSGAPGSCSLTSPAFCDTFDQGPSATRGRAGDLDPARWSGGRLAPSDFSNNGVVNPVRAAPIPACKASFLVTSVYPKDDTLICDSAGTRSAQLMTAVAIQNYGNNSYMIRQPFDFAGRTGKIAFDVDAASDGLLGAYVEVDITQDPVPAPTFREYENFEVGPIPRNGLMMKWMNNCGLGTAAITLGNVMVYSNYAGSIIAPSYTVNGTGCAKTKPGFLNHFEINVSQQQVEIYGSDYSPDNGQTYPNFRRLYAATLNLPFTQGYVHMSARNHATLKYGYGPDGIYHWDNIGFDGPVLTNWRAYEIPDNNTAGTHDNAPIRNLGYQLQDGTGGKPAGIYDPTTRLSSLTFQGVNVTGAVTARLTLNAFFNAVSHTGTTGWGLRFRFNGGAWRDRFLTPTEVQVINTAGSAGNLALVLDVPVADLRAGSNALELLPVGASMDLPPAVANIDLIIALDGTSVAVPSAPSNLRIVR
jgi:hypothetical protein